MSANDVYRHSRIVLFAIVIALTLPVIGSGQELHKVRFLHVGFATSQAPVFVAREAGYFTKHRLDVEIIRIGGSSRLVQSMLAGDGHLAQVASSAVIEAALAGADMKIVAATGNRPLFRLMASPRIKSLQDLRMKRVGITRFGSTGDFLLRWALTNRWGLAPERDVPILQIGGVPEILLAAKAGGIDAAPLPSPDNIRAEKIGWKELADLSSIGIEYLLGTMASTQTYIQSNKDVLTRFMKSYVQGIHLMRTDKNFTIKALEKFMRNNDKELLEAVYNQNVLEGMNKVPLPSVTAVQTVLDELAERRPGAKSRKPEEFIDVRIIKELQTSGYIGALYK